MPEGKRTTSAKCSQSLPADGPPPRTSRPAQRPEQLGARGGEHEVRLDNLRRRVRGSDLRISQLDDAAGSVLVTALGERQALPGRQQRIPRRRQRSLRRPDREQRLIDVHAYLLPEHVEL